MRTWPLLLSVLVTGCAATQTHERLSQPTEQRLTAHLGGQVLTIVRTADLPNAFGGADIFGGKVDRGYSDLRYQGLNDEGNPVFRLVEVNTVSSESTVTRRSPTVSTVRSWQSGSQVQSTVHTAPRPSASTDALPPNVTEFVVDVDKTDEFRVADIRVEILEAAATSLTYKLSR